VDLPAGRGDELPRDGADGVALLAHADRAVYRAKR
jgi:hypothetical protein